MHSSLGPEVMFGCNDEGHDQSNQLLLLQGELLWGYRSYTVCYRWQGDSDPDELTGVSSGQEVSERTLTRERFLALEINDVKSLRPLWHESRSISLPMEYHLLGVSLVCRRVSVLGAIRIRC